MGDQQNEGVIPKAVGEIYDYIEKVNYWKKCCDVKSPCSLLALLESQPLDKNNTIQYKQNNCHIWVWFLHNILTVYCNVTRIRAVLEQYLVRRYLVSYFCSWTTRKSQLLHRNYMLGNLDFSVSEHWVGSVSSLGSLDAPVALGWGLPLAHRDTLSPNTGDWA